MYSTTGLEKCEIADACVMICAQVNDDDRKWPPRLGLYLSVVIALTYLRRNRVQAELAETYGVSQSTISRAISAVTPLLGRVLKDFVPTADDLGPGEQYIVDGTLLPCWSWAGHPELYSGKHKTTGMNVQVACTGPGQHRAQRQRQDHRQAVTHAPARPRVNHSSQHRQDRDPVLPKRIRSSEQVAEHRVDRR
jgi:hypothetical protein